MRKPDEQSMVTVSVKRLFSKLLDKRASRVLFAFLDQGIFSITNFALNILLARWLSEQAYGAFAVSFSVYIIISAFQGALVLEPISVFGPNLSKEELAGYLNKQFAFHLKINIVISLVVLVCSFFLHSPVKEAFIGAAVAIPFTFILWLYRRICYIDMQTQLAALISSVYAALMFFGILILSSLQLLNPFTAYIILAVSSLITAVIFLPAFQIKLGWSTIWGFDFFKDPVFIESWNYGKWILSAMISEGIQSLVFIPLIGLILDLRQAAGFRTMQNYLLPISQIQAAVTLMVVPRLAKKVGEGGNILTWKSITKVSSYYVLPAVLYTIPILYFREELTALIYKNSYYNHFLWMVPFLLLSSVVLSCTLSFAVTLRAVKVSPPLLWSKLSAALLTLILGSLLIYWVGLSGVIVALYAAVVAEGITLFAAFTQARRSARFSNT